MKKNHFGLFIKIIIKKKKNSWTKLGFLQNPIKFRSFKKFGLRTEFQVLFICATGTGIFLIN